MTTALKNEPNHISEEEYLAGELASEIRHEYVDGQVYAMVGGSDNHNRLSATISREFGNHLKKKSCDVFQSDFKVKIGTKYFYPDVVVKCADDNRFYTEEPIIIVEVLSPSTRHYDEIIKLRTYQTIPSLVEFVLISQDVVRVMVFQRVGELWTSAIYGLGDEVVFTSIGFTISVEEIYERVTNEDMNKFLQEKTAEGEDEDKSTL